MPLKLVRELSNPGVQDALETSRPQLEQGRHQLAVALPADAILLEADRVRLAQVLANLLDNAAHFTPDGGHIVLSARGEACDVLVSVRDDGIGIAADQLPQIFDLFAQGAGGNGNGNGRNHDGLGIGLTMARSMVEMHGGTVTATSGGVGMGSELTVRLPLPYRSQPAAPARDAADGAVPLAGQRILIVDDNRDAADSLGLLLELEGAEVRVAYDGKGALEAVERFAAQAVLLDLGKAGMDGYEVAQRLRRDPRLQGLRIAALTGWGQDADRRHTRGCGFDFHLTKPVDFEALKAWLSGG